MGALVFATMADDEGYCEVDSARRQAFLFLRFVADASLGSLKRGKPCLTYRFYESPDQKYHCHRDEASRFSRSKPVQKYG